MKLITPIVNPDLPTFGDLEKDIQSILNSKQITKGRYLQKLERAIARYLGLPHAVCVSSCTLGLMLVIQCLDLHGEIIVPDFTFIATLEAVLWNGLTPVIVDVDPDSFTIDPQKVEAAITPRTAAILAVHLFGNPANCAALQKIARRHTIKLIFDSAHAFGARIDDRCIGNFGDAEVFSMSPTKLLIAGEGGVITTRDTHLAEKLMRARDYGGRGNGEYDILGLNARLTEYNALLGLKSLRRIKKAVAHRNKVARAYIHNLSTIPGLSFQYIPDAYISAYKDFSILVDESLFGLSRDDLQKELLKKKIETRRYFDPPLHAQPIVKKSSFRAHDVSISQNIASNILQLPMWSTLDLKIVHTICYTIKSIHQKHQR